MHFPIQSPTRTALFFEHHELFYRFAMRSLISVERVADGNDRHELKALRQFEEFENSLLVFQNFPDPGRSEPMGMHRQQEVLQTGSDGLAVLDDGRRNYPCPGKQESGRRHS